MNWPDAFLPGLNHNLAKNAFLNVKLAASTQRGGTATKTKFSVSSLTLKPQHGEHSAAEPQCQIPDSKFKTQVCRKVCQEKQEITICITDESGQ